MTILHNDHDLTATSALSRPDRIRLHPLFLQEYERLQKAEIGRAYCGHSMEHFLDVARVCYIQVLERRLPISKDVVYAAGLLHDIGKGLQYECGLPHHEESARLAERILPECGYDSIETTQIINAILAHRKPTRQDDSLVEILYLADKKTRLCFSCPASVDCNWSFEKRTKEIMY